MTKTVRIDALPESAWRYSGYDAIVCVDVLLSATTVVTAFAQGRRVLTAPDEARAAQLSAGLQNPLLLTDAYLSPERAVRFGGPAALAAEPSPRPLVHISPLASMLAAAGQRARAYVACLRNLEATANEIALNHRRVVLIGAGEDDEVCAADQMATAWLAHRLQGRGFELEGRYAVEEVTRWARSEVSLIGLSRSAERLRARGRGAELAFVLGHVNDLELVCVCERGEIANPAAQRRKQEEEMPTPAWGIRAVQLLPRG